MKDLLKIKIERFLFINTGNNSIDVNFRSESNKLKQEIKILKHKLTKL